MTMTPARHAPAPALRLALIATGLAALGLAAGFSVQAPWAIALWPWGGGRLSFLFIASILAASAVPVVWIGMSGEFAAVTGGAINLCAMYSAVAVFSLGRHAQAPSRPGVLAFAIACGAAALACLALVAWARRLPFHDRRPTPRGVRVSFAVFLVVLVAVGAALVLQRPMFPWRLDAEQSVLYGLVFLGAACYFLHGLLWPVWGNAQGQLLGFLAYDLVLIGPFLRHFERVEPTLRLNLIVYVAVLVCSGGLALWYLWRLRTWPASARGQPR